MVLQGGAGYRVPPDAIDRLCVAVQSQRGSSYLLPPGVTP